MEAATSSVLASAFSPSMERMVLFATMSAPSGFGSPSPGFPSPSPGFFPSISLSFSAAFTASSTAFLISSSVAVSGSPNAFASSFKSMIFPPSEMSSISREFTNANIPSIAGVFVSATECIAVAFWSLFRTNTTGERYLYSLFFRYSAAFGVHSTFAMMASSPL